MVKKLLTILAVAGLLAAAALATTFVGRPLPVGPAPAFEIPVANPPPQMRLSALLAGKMFSRAAFAYRGGSFGEERVFGMGAILVQHPQGNLLFDAGFGREVDAHVRTLPWLAQKASRHEKETPVAEQLQRAGIALPSLAGVVLTHAHWDHVSGLQDLPGVPVWVTQEERDFVVGGDPMAELARQLGTQHYKVYGFASGPYLGFARSHDVFGDGSVVIVPAPGHTPGSVIAFIATPDGKRYALVGDLVWQMEGIELPAERPWLARSMVDVDDESVRRLVVQMHQIAARMPGLTVVPAHDRRVWETLPALGSP